VRANVDTEFFYGVKLQGTWDSKKREMSLTLPVPGDVKVTKIKWIDAQENTLGYDPSSTAVKTKWKKDTSDICNTKYKLTIDQSTFFGKGSRFTLTGKQMKTSLEVDATEKVVQTIDGYAYARDRTMVNEVPLIVNLIQQMTVSAHFNTVFSTEKMITIELKFTEITDMAQFLSECSALFTKKFQVTCLKAEAGPDGKTTHITFAGQATQINRAVQDAKKNGYKTENFGPFDVDKKPKKHHEFVFVISAKESLSGPKTIEIEMEVHSRSCIDHTKPGKGIAVTTAGNLKIDETVAPTKFVWKKDPKDDTKIEKQIEHSLCVEKVTWTFAPKGYEETSYVIPVEFTLNDNLGTFITDAQVNLKTADVLDSIGFGATAAMYSDESCTQTATQFALGDKFYVKISLQHPAVDAESINCSILKLTQTKEGVTSEETNLKETQYNFMEKQLATNQVVCGAQLDGTHFHARVDGYHTDLSIEVTVNYVQGRQADIKKSPVERRRLVFNGRSLLTTQNFEDQTRDADKELLHLEMEILPEQMEISVAETKTAESFVEEFEGWCYGSGTPNSLDGFMQLGEAFEVPLEQCATLVQQADSSATYFVWWAKPGYATCYLHTDTDNRQRLCAEGSGDFGKYANFRTYRINANNGPVPIHQHSNAVNQISGRTHWFKDYSGGNSWNGRTFTSSSGASKKLYNGVIPYLEGTTATKIDWGNILSPTYTICTLARYTGASKGRIFDGSNLNWLHDFYYGNAAVAYYGGWNTVTSYNTNGLNWNIFCGQNGGNWIFRTNGKVDRGNGRRWNHIPSSVRTNSGMFSNEGDLSDFAIMDIITWNRALSSAEINTVIDYMEAKLKLDKCECVNGIPVENVCPTGYKCKSCDEGYVLTDRQTCEALKDCEPNDQKKILGLDCKCGANACQVEKYCWTDNTCRNGPKPKSCVVNDLTKIINEPCRCAADSSTAECKVGNFCVTGNVCLSYGACVENEFKSVSTPCYCSGSTDICALNNFCYDGHCKEKAKHDSCIADAYYGLADSCVCGQEESLCTEGSFCYRNTCEAKAGCSVRANVDTEFFYGVKLQGTWDSKKREMSLTLPVPGDVKVTKIKWIDAQENTLGYDPSSTAVKTKWKKDTSDICNTKYKLTIDQSTFFGKGSRFTLTGKQMKTSLEVDATEKVVQTIDGYAYARDRTMVNEVPLIVNLIQQMTVSAHFNTVFSTEKMITIELKFTEITDMAQFLSECSALFTKKFQVTCLKAEAGPDGKTTHITFAGQATQINRAVQDAKKNGYKTENFGPFDVDKKPKKHHEFVFVISAKESLSGPKTIEIEMEVHSRSCIDHTKPGKGIAVTTAGNLKIDETVAPTKFVWKKDPKDDTKIEKQIEHSLCVEKVTWTFAPKGYEETSYVIPVEFTLNDNLGTFITDAQVNLKTADVLDSIGFGATAAMYSDESCTQTATQFALGDKFYVKISLQHPAVDAESINCSILKLTQTKEGVTSEETNLKETQYNFMEKQLATNQVVCGAQLDGTHFHARVDGYHTDLSIEVTVNYVQGRQADIKKSPVERRRLVFNGRRLLTTQNFEDQTRDADKELLHLEMEILPEQMEISVAETLFTIQQGKNHIGKFMIGMLLGACATLIYSTINNGKKENVYKPLPEIEL